MSPSGQCYKLIHLYLGQSLLIDLVRRTISLFQTLPPPSTDNVAWSAAIGPLPSNPRLTCIHKSSHRPSLLAATDTSHTWGLHFALRIVPSSPWLCARFAFVVVSLPPVR